MNSNGKLPFLYKVAALFYSQYGAEIYRLTFVFPNRRAGLFFRKYLSEIAAKPIFSPAIWTINDIFERISGKRSADRIRTLFRLYEIYCRRSGSSETFDDFLYWGEMLLNDFDDVDKYMADAQKLFRNVSDLKELDEGYEFLSDEQIRAIRSFWSTFQPKSDSPNQKQFLELWEVLYDLYTELRAELSADGCGYDGMLFREAVEQLQLHPENKLPFEHVVFVGLNALSTSEECLLLELQKRGVADFYWDYASEQIRDKDNKASFFMERNLALFPSHYSLPDEELALPQIEVIGMPSAIGQAKQVYSLLEEFNQEEPLNEENALRTAVILPDEHLLVPVLNSIPDTIRQINVTMGYPLSVTPVASLMDAILSLQKNTRYLSDKNTEERSVLGYYYQDVLPILEHNYITMASGKIAAQLVDDIRRNNRIYIGYTDLQLDTLLSAIFTPVTDAAQCSDYLIGILEKLNAQIRNNDSEPDEDSTGQGRSAAEVEQEFIFHYFATVNRLKEVMQDVGVEMRIDTYFRLLHRMTELITIPFEGEPLAGLQIMGVLETRAIDFDRIILLSMNDGIFPMKRTANSFIPYNLRRGFGLPTYEHQDSIWAYHFYHLLQRSRKVVLLYDTRSGDMQTGEVSRYVLQLKYHYGVKMRERFAIYNVTTNAMSPIYVSKDSAVLEKLRSYCIDGNRELSASAINMYLDCPLKFYFTYVENMREEDEVSETIESNVFGRILHKVMEKLYQPLQGKLVTADILKLLAKDESKLTEIITCAFAEIFFKSETPRVLKGQNYLIGEMIRLYVKKILSRDAKYTPFHYIESEKHIKDVLTTRDGTVVQLKGFIDRVDAVGEGLRIIDYKTGSEKSDFKSIPQLFDKTVKKRPKDVMQVFLYAWMYKRSSGYDGRRIQPYIYYVRSLFDEKFDPIVSRHIPYKKNEKVEDFESYGEEFETELCACVSEIFDANIGFMQTENDIICKDCPFNSLCGR